MGVPSEPKRVLLFVGTLFSDREAYYEAIKILEKIYGAIILETPPRLWDYSNYYNEEIGSPIFRRFVFFKNLISEEDIADIKIKTNQIEKELSVEGKRKINLDPGYIGLAKLVLATTKDYSHRIYLRRGIYGEVTLIYRGNSFTPHINTYRDYADREYIELFNLARDIYRGLLQKTD